MKKVTNLAEKNHTHQYGDNVSDLVAVCQSYCTTNNLSSWFYGRLHSGMDFTEKLPIVEGEKTLACGDWCIVKTTG
jgi:hypothetical protein